MDVSPRKRSKIVTLHEHTAKTQREIAAEVGVNQSTVARIISRYAETGSFSPTRKNRCGRKKMTLRDERLLLQENRLNPRMTSNEHRVSRNLDVSSRTVRWVLSKHGRISRKPMCKQLLTEPMKKKRLSWAKLHRSWTIEQWRKGLLTYESHFVQGQQVSVCPSCVWRIIDKPTCESNYQVA